jgi:hypothetical protein
MREISTFQATTATATSISSLFIFFPRSSQLHRGERWHLQGSHRSYQGFHKEIYRVRSGFHPRIKQTMSRPMCTRGWIRCTVLPATTN